MAAVFVLGRCGQGGTRRSVPQTEGGLLAGWVLLKSRRALEDAAVGCFCPLLKVGERGQGLHGPVEGVVVPHQLPHPLGQAWSTEGHH